MLPFHVLFSTFCFVSFEESELHSNNKTSDNSVQHLVRLSGAAPVSHCPNEARGRLSRMPHSAEITCHHMCLKHLKPVGKCNNLFSLKLIQIIIHFPACLYSVPIKSTAYFM